MTAPIEPGKYEGDKFFAEGGIIATHVWSGGKWIELGDQTRTHGEHSAVDDAPAGMEAIPADMPNAAHGDVPLQYNLQNFNALVSANTALISELAARDAVITEIRAQIDILNDSLREARHGAEIYEGHAERYSKLAQERKVDLDEARSELTFASDQRDELQRKVDRMSGYLDRVLDDEDSIRAPETRQAPAPKPAVGPDLESIPRAVKRTARGDVDMPYAFSTSRLHEIQGFDPVQRPRRY